MITVLSSGTQQGFAQGRKVNPRLWEIAQRQGMVKVILDLEVSVKSEAKLSRQEILVQRNAISAAQDTVLAEMGRRKFRVTGRLRTVPAIGLEVEPYILGMLENSPRVRKVSEDRLLRPLLADSVPLVGANQAWTTGYTGNGWAVAILDTGVHKNHPSLSGTNKIIAEACFSDSADCPNGFTAETGPDTGTACTWATIGCLHGTIMAATAAGSGNTPGVAKEAKIISIRIASRFTGQLCAEQGEDPCVLYNTLDMFGGLDYVNYLRSNGYTIAAANLSIGEGQYDNQETCDQNAPDNLKTVIDELRTAGIATVIAAGNESYTNAMNSPACISSAVSVGATTKPTSTQLEAIRSTSNSASFLSLLAPGESITLPNLSGGGTWITSGTSVAAPHVAGAWAILKQKKSDATVDQVLAALQTTSKPLKDTRDSNLLKQYVQCRIRIDRAVDYVAQLFTPISVPGVSQFSTSQINRCGQIVGNAWDQGPFLLSEDDVTIFDPPGVFAWGTGINDLGDISGRFYDDGIGQDRGFRISGAQLTAIDAVNTQLGTWVNEINNSRAVSGVFWNTYTSGFLWGSQFTRIDPPGVNPANYPFPCCSETIPQGINDLGQVVGYYKVDPSDPVKGFLFSGGQFTSIEYPGASESWAYGINNAGQIVGSYADGDAIRGYLLSNGVFSSLPDAPDSDQTWLYGITDAGQIIGEYYDASWNPHGFLLNSLNLP
jgi:subtilisin family serine protease